jgi:multimeric flavodoxin WrbA
VFCDSLKSKERAYQEIDPSCEYPTHIRGYAMKVLGINSSPRRKHSRTLKLVEAVLGGARQHGAETELVDVCALDIRYCLGCQGCYAKGMCVRDDDFPDLLDTMVRADGIVLGSPVYMYGVTAQLKTVIDRMADAVYCQMFAGKYGCAVVTAGSSGEKDVLRYMNRILNELGAVTVGEVGVTLDVNPTALDAAIGDAVMLGQTLADAIQTRRQYPNQESLLAEHRERIKQFIAANKELLAHAHEWWMERGWI